MGNSNCDLPEELTKRQMKKLRKKLFRIAKSVPVELDCDPCDNGEAVVAVDPGGLRRCRFRYTYIWLSNGNSFWFYPTYVGRTSVAGWRWRRFRWTYYGTDLRRIISFRCV